METVEEAWGFMEKLLSSPLVWRQVSFTLVPREKDRRYVGDYLNQKQLQGIIREFKYEVEIEKADVLKIRNAYNYTDI